MGSVKDLLSKGNTQKRLEFIINSLYFALIGAIIFLVFKYVIGWILPFLLGFAIAYLFRPVINWLNSKLKLKRNIAAFIVVLIGFGLLGWGFTLLTAKVIDLLKTLLTDLPLFYNNQIYPALENLFDNIGNILGSPSTHTENLASVRDFVISLSKQAGTALTGLTARVPSFMIGFVFTILASFFISIYYNDFTSFIMRQVPGKGRKIMRDTKKIFVDTLGKYIKAALILMVITFTELSVMFAIIGIKNPILVAAGIAVFDALPVFGTGGIMIPWILLELLRSNYTLALSLLVVYVIVTLVRNFIEPKVVGDQLGLNPLVAIIAVYLGYVLGGVFGMIIMPITAQILITLNRLGSINIYRMEE